MASAGAEAVAAAAATTFTWQHVQEQMEQQRIPPAPILWVTALVDTVLGTARWRSWLLGNMPLTDSIAPTLSSSSVSSRMQSWLAWQVPSVFQVMPDMMTFQSFCQLHPDLSPTHWRTLYRFAFESDSTVLAVFYTPTALVVLCLLVLTLRLIKAVCLPLFADWGRRAALHTHGPEWQNTPSNQVRILKFGEYCFRLIFHSAMSWYGIAYFWHEPWWNDWDLRHDDGVSHVGLITLFRGFPHHAVSPPMTWYYLLQAAYNLDAFVSLLEMSFVLHWQNPVQRKSNAMHVRDSSNKDCKCNNRSLASFTFQLQWPCQVSWSSTARGDFQEMFIHHVATNLLIFGSSTCRLTRAGSMIFWVHDVSDVPIDLSKLANFLKWKITTISCFIAMVTMWCWTRLYILPVHIGGAVWRYVHLTLEQGRVPLILFLAYRHIFYVLLTLLVALHVAWFFTFLRIFQTLIVKRECHDLSEHKNGEQQDHHQHQQRDAVPIANGNYHHNNHGFGHKTRHTDSNHAFIDEKKED